MNCFYNWFSKKTQVISKSNQLLLLLLGLIFGFSLNSKAQATLYNSVDVEVSRVSWNVYCADGIDIGTGLGCTGNDGPDPRYIYSVGFGGSNSGDIYLGSPEGPNPLTPELSNKSDTGNESINSATHNFSFSASCANQLSFNFEAWEDDGCGNSWTYSSGCVNDDDNRTISTGSYNLPNSDNSATRSFNLGGGYSMTFRIITEVQDAPTLTTVPPVICRGQSAVLSCTAPVSGSTVIWFTDSNDPQGSIIGDGVVITTPSLNTLPATIYFAESTDAIGTCIGEVDFVEITEGTIGVVSAPTITGDTEICPGESTILTANSSSGALINWYADAALNTQLAGDAQFITPSTTTTTTYYAAAFPINGCPGPGTSTAVTVNVLAAPAAPAPVSDTIYTQIGQSVTLEATTTVPGGIINWYDEDPALGGTQFATGSPVASPPILVPVEDFFVTVGDPASDCDNLRRAPLQGNAATVIVLAALPADAPNIINDTICQGETATLTAIPQGTGTTVWFSDGAGADSIGSGDTFETGILQQTTTYYAAELDDSGLGSIVGVRAVVNSKPTPPNVATSYEVCVGGEIEINVLDEQIGDQIHFIAIIDSSGDTSEDFNFLISQTTEIFTGLFTTPQEQTLVLSIVDAATGCESDVAIANVFVYPLLESPVVSGDTEICAGQFAMLSVENAQGDIKWYSDMALTNQVGSGVTFNTGILTADATYYVTVNNNIEGCVSLPTEVTVAVNALPDAPTAENDSVCLGESAELTATLVGGGQVQWFSQAGQTTPLATGNTFTTTALSQTTLYYVNTIDLATGCQSALVPVYGVVNPKPQPVVAEGITLCVGESGEISATGSGTGEIIWYDADQNELERDAMPPATATLEVGPYATAGTYIFLVRQNDGNCDGDWSQVEVVVGETPTAAPSVTGETTICNGESTLLTAAGNAGGVINWYSDTTGAGTIVATGAQLATPALTSNTTYFVSESFGTCEGPIAEVEITVNDNPAAIELEGDTVCEGETATLTVTVNGGGTINWYEDASGNVSVGTGTSYTTAPLAQTTTYYAQETSADGCVSPIASVQAVVEPKPIAPSIDPLLESCEGETLNVPVATIEAIGNTLVSILMNEGGDTIANQSITIAESVTVLEVVGLAAGTYTHSVAVDNGDCVSDEAVQTIIIHELPEVPTVLDTVEVCYGETATLFAFGEVNNPNSIITWFDNANFDPIATGWQYETQPITMDQVFYATITDENGCESAQATITVIVNELPANPSATGDTVCHGYSATLTATGNGGLLTWYSDGAATNEVATGDTYVTPELMQTTTFYVSEQNTSTGCVSNLVAVTAVVEDGPEAPQATNVTVCVGEEVELTATGSGTGELIWYDANNMQLEVDAMPPAQGSITVGPWATAGTYIFYVSQQADGCESPKAEIEVEVMEVPEPPTVENQTICSGESITLTALGTGGQINWYADATTTTLVSTGSQFDTGELTATTSYWVTQSYGMCESAAVEVEVTVDPLPATPTVGTNAPICEGETLELTSSDAFGVTFNWVGPNGWTSTEQNPTIENVSEANHQGVYTLTITDNNTGCTSMEASVNVMIYPTPEAPSLTSNAPICEGEELVLTAGIVEGGEYTFYDADNNVLQQDSMNTYTIDQVSSDQAGVYGVSVSVNGCMSATTTLDVIVKERPDAPAVSNNGPICEYEELQLFATIISGATYTWVGPNGQQLGLNGPIVTIESASTSDAGEYGVFITVDGCSSDTATTTVEVTPAPVLPQNPTTNSPVCEHDTLLLQAPYDANLDYSWTGPNGYVADTTYIDTVNNFYVEAIVDANENDHQGFYTLTVTDRTTGCSSKEYAVLVIVNKFPDNIIADNNGPICQGEDLQLNVTSIVNATYTWSGPGNFTSTEQNPVRDNAQPEMSGTYEVTIELGGCISRTISTDVIIYENPIADAGPDLVIEEGQVFQLNGNGSIGAIDFAWLGEDQTWFDDPTSPNPYVGVGPTGPLPARDEPYVFVLTVYNEHGCTDQDTVLVTIFKTDDLIIPNVITPNGDGVNDTWVIQYLQNLENYTLSVYARGGTLIFKALNDYANDWDGTMNGTDLPEGTYWYTIQSENAPVFKGYIEIVR